MGQNVGGSLSAVVTRCATGLSVVRYSKMAAMSSSVCPPVSGSAAARVLARWTAVDRICLEVGNRIHQGQCFLRVVSIGTGQADRKRNALSITDQMPFAPAFC